jgi:hypothetical protein
MDVSLCIDRLYVISFHLRGKNLLHEKKKPRIISKNNFFSYFYYPQNLMRLSNDFEGHFIVAFRLMLFNPYSANVENRVSSL